MKFSKIAAYAAAVTVLAGVVVALSVPAEAAKKRKRSYIYYGHEDRQVMRTRTGTRLTVRRRSFLDPGTETKAYDEHYADYAFQPSYNTPPGMSPHDPTVSFNRMPLNDPFDMPGRKF